MIKSDKGKVTIDCHGDGALVLAELGCAIKGVLDSGMPVDLVIDTAARVISYHQQEEKKLTDDFVEELLRRIKEKRDAQTNKSNSDTKES